MKMINENFLIWFLKWSFTKSLQATSDWIVSSIFDELMLKSELGEVSETIGHLFGLKIDDVEALLLFFVDWESIKLPWLHKVLSIIGKLWDCSIILPIINQFRVNSFSDISVEWWVSGVYIFLLIGFSGI
mgnify:CR=1 FL=1